MIPDKPDESKVIELSRYVEAAWLEMKDACPYRAPERDKDGQGPICIHDENSSGMEWCEPGSCPFIAV